MKIAFWDNYLGERGTSIALFDYAYFNIKILKNESIILYNKNSNCNIKKVVEKFEKEFEVCGVNDFSEVDDVIRNKGVDMLYVIKSGEYDGKLSRVVKTVVHCVFNCSQQHGDVYASIAPWVKFNNGKFPTVPHMINLPIHNLDMRYELSIPNDAVVFGRHGGYEQFDIKYVQTIVYDVAKKNPKIYFLFVNTKPFCDRLPNIIHLNKIIDLHEKVRFINTCDAMLWARSDGETFGLAIGEFSSKNKPVICTQTGDIAHISILKDKAILYNQETLHSILKNFDKKIMFERDWNAYTEFTPEKVMRLFQEVFIDT